jgi:hypothetical protein
MRVTLNIDPTDRRDIAMQDEALGWLHRFTRNTWAVTETDPDAYGQMTLTYEFWDPLDASDFRYSTSAANRARLV